jgi:hypothetical protein
MGHIKEPKGVDLMIGPNKITEKDLRELDAIIAQLKSGKKNGFGKSKPLLKRKRAA